MLIDPLAAFALTLSVSVGGVAYVLHMAAIEARQKGAVIRRKPR